MKKFDNDFPAQGCFLGKRHQNDSCFDQTGFFEDGKCVLTESSKYGAIVLLRLGDTMMLASIPLMDVGGINPRGHRFETPAPARYERDGAIRRKRFNATAAPDA
jgi:hypothetical protein